MAENHVLIQPPNMYTQTDVSKEDISKNLVSGEFERQYRGTVMEKVGRRRNSFAILAACIGALTVWLIVLTVVREVQISRLRSEVDGLSSDVVTLAETIKALNQKMTTGRYFDLEDAIYADSDEEEEGSKSSPTSVEKIHDLTVLEDEKDILDDDDMYDDDEDDDDGESGDYYMDYDTRSKKVGTTNMVRLKPEDFRDTVINVGEEKDFKEIKRLLNENPENPDIVAGLHAPPSPAEKEEKKGNEPARSKRSVISEATPEVVDPYYPPRFIAKEEKERRKTKKFSPLQDASTSTQTKLSLTRTIRSDEAGYQRRPFIAAHFHGNTSHLNTAIHEHYKGNGLVRVAHGAAHNVWYPSGWTAASPHPRPTLTRAGHIHVHHTGVYLVYVQIYYLDAHDIISWVLHRTNPEIEGRETILQCAQSTHSTEVLDKPNSCFSSAALFLKAGDKLAVRNTGGDRHSLMEPEKSFIGLIKLADADDPNDEEF